MPKLVPGDYHLPYPRAIGVKVVLFGLCRLYNSALFALPNLFASRSTTSDIVFSRLS